MKLLAALALTAIGGLVGWWLRGRSSHPAALQTPLPLPERPGPRVLGVEPELLWARVDGTWVALERAGQDWVTRPRDPSVEVATDGFPPLLRWARETAELDGVSEALETWTEACVACSRVAWLTEVPTGDQLLQAWARRARPTEDPGSAFAIWLVGSLGKAGRRGLLDPETARQRATVARALHRAAARVVAVVDPTLALELEAPAGVGPRQAERWLADRALAEVLGNPVVAEVLEPVVVLRPALLRGDDVLLEGEVA